MRRRASKSEVLRHRRARRLALAAVFLFATLFYGWTAASAGDRAQFQGYPDYYAELAQGFLHGELSIPTPAPKGLLDLSDPYGPNLNARYRNEFGDLALYHGRLYLDWGPAPVVTLFVPWQLLHLGQLSGNLAVFFYSELGLAFVLALVCLIVDQFLPAVRTRWVVLVALALAFSTVVVFIERQPETYEVAVASGYAFAMLGLYLLATAWLKRGRSRGRLALSSLAFGLAAASRQDLVLLGLLPAGVLLERWRAGRSCRRAARPRERVREPARMAILALGPFALVVVLLGLYNWARFGSFTQIGVSYQLAGFNPKVTPYYQLAYVAPSLYLYLVSPLHWSATFPFISIPPPSVPMALPAHYGLMIRAGLVDEAPILVMGLVAPLALRRRLDRRLKWALLAVVASALLIVLVISWSIPGGQERYEVDFATLFLLAALICWLAWSPRHLAGRVAVRVVGTVLIAYGVLVGMAISIAGYHDQLPTTQPALYRHLVSATAGIGDLITKVLGHPVITGVDTDAGVTTAPSWDTIGTGTIVYLNLTDAPAAIHLVLPAGGNYELEMSIGPGPQYAMADGRPISVVVASESGIEHIDYVNGNLEVPFRLRGGDATIRLSEQVEGRRLPAADSVLSASDLTVVTARGLP